jgi:hypothetical protein
MIAGGLCDSSHSLLSFLLSRPQSLTPLALREILSSPQSLQTSEPHYNYISLRWHTDTLPGLHDMEAIVAQSATTVVKTPRSNSPLPTDSMVTVRLSDAQIHPVSNDSVRNSRTRTRSSSANSHSSSISARSSTRSSTPSNTTVDWEELEKTEEQEPRDQATDEVCLKVLQTT